MKKYKVFVNVISNIIIIAMIFGLYVACVPTDLAAAFKPIYRVETNENCVAIMINVYQGSEYVEDMIEIFERYEVKCTFFVGGIWVSKNHDIIKRMAQSHEIGNHGYLHRDHAKLNAKQNKEEIVLCEKLVEEITGVKTRLFAPPSGSIGDTMLSVCEELDYKVIMWSKDTIDWRDKDYQLVVSRATKEVKSGDMILMHPTEHTVKALPQILDAYRKKGLTPVTVSRLLKIDNNY